MTLLIQVPDAPVRAALAVLGKVGLGQHRIRPWSPWVWRSWSSTFSNWRNIRIAQVTGSDVPFRRNLRYALFTSTEIRATPLTLMCPQQAGELLPIRGQF